MNKEKQIDEMVKVYEEARLKANETLGSMNKGAGNWYAEAFYTAGYRKASDVAREIFEEIEEMLNMQAIIVCQTRETASTADVPRLSYLAMLDGRMYSLRVVEEHIAELKKKYTERENNDG